jgi:alanine racemase
MTGPFFREFGQGFVHRWDAPPHAGSLALCFDTRTLTAGAADPTPQVFIALRGPWRDGHDHVREAWDKGVRHFILAHDPGATVLPQSDVICLPDPLTGLQDLVGAWRRACGTPLIAITGSNGKTVVKEWLATLLGDEQPVHSSPRSYNSQLGVASTLWALAPEHGTGIIEAGISAPGEMERLAACIDPDAGVLTHLGEAHLAAFEGPRALLQAKLALFPSPRCRWVVVPEGLTEAVEALRSAGKQVITWGPGDDADLRVLDQQVVAAPDGGQQRWVQVAWRGGDGVWWCLPFADETGMRNALTAATTALAWGLDMEQVRSRLGGLRAVDLRMQRLLRPDGCWVLSDAYTNDWPALELALHDLLQLPGSRGKAAIIGEVPGMQDLAIERLASWLQKRPLAEVWLVGAGWRPLAHLLPDDAPVRYFDGAEAAMEALEQQPFSGWDVLVKGPRAGAFERFVEALTRRGHSAVLEIDLEAVVANYRLIRDHVRRQCGRPVGMVAVVKASGYGTNGPATARALERQGVEMLAVSCTEEGVELREAGIQARVLVFNPDPSTFPALIRHHLEPELHDLAQTAAFEHHLARQGTITPYPVHLQVETGMNRLGFSEEGLQQLLADWGEKHAPWLRVESVFSHLASAEDPAADAFTMRQLGRFEKAVTALRSALPAAAHPLRRHILNSSGTRRFAAQAGDWVRVGIALYGIGDGTAPGERLGLQPALRFRTVISAVRTVPAGEGIGYGSTDPAPHPRRIATLPVGYADGYPRHLSNGAGWVDIQGHRAPVVGRVCMDMTLVDVTTLPPSLAQPGMEVILFGDAPRIEDLARAAGTIPYEIIARIPPRVHREQRGG